LVSLHAPHDRILPPRDRHRALSQRRVLLRVLLRVLRRHVWRQNSAGGEGWELKPDLVHQ
jgi:hypothetical protein